MAAEMGCWGSKNGGNNNGNKLNPTAAETEAPPPRPRKLPWTPEASQWRWLLRTTQSLVAACLYVASTWIRAPTLPVLLQLFLALLLMPPLTLAYHFLSLNKAGGYYDNYVEMFTQLPQLIKNIRCRNSSEYRAEIEHERRDGIVRTVNGLETGALFLLVAWPGALLSGARHTSDFASGFLWRIAETTVFFCLHRLLGGNVLEGAYSGFMQPEAMWYFECVLSDTAGVDCRMTPILQHPEPSY